MAAQAVLAGSFPPVTSCSAPGRNARHAPSPPSSTVKLLPPTPSGEEPIALRAHVVESSENRAVVEAAVKASGEICATCRGVFVAVKPGHPAYDRW